MSLHALKTHCVCSVVRADWTVTQKLHANWPTDLAIGRDDVHNTEQRHQRYADDPQQQLLPEVQRLHEAHLRPEPDAGEMLLAVGMRYELQQHTRNTPVTVTATGHHQFLDNSNDHWKRLCLVSWAAAPCVWTLRAPTRNLLTYLLTYMLYV